MSLAIFKKNAAGGGRETDSADERERRAAALLAHARAAKSDISSYWRRMRSYYDGTHETARETGDFLASLDLPWRPAGVPDGYMHVESQIEAEIPDFEFSGRGGTDAEKARQREQVVRYIVQNSDIKIKNAVNERRLNLYGTAIWKLALCTGDNGEPEIAVENPPLESVFPDPAATSVDDCEYIACVYRMSKERAARVFADDLRRLGLSIDGILRIARAGKRKKLSDMQSFDDAGETVEVVEWWHRQSDDGTAVCACGDDGKEAVSYSYAAGDIALSIFMEGTEVRYVPKFWTKTSCRKYPFVIYSRIPSDGSLWGKSELETIIPLIDAADRQLAFAQLNTAFFANDILVYEENAFAPDSYPENRPGAIWKLRPGMMEKVARLGGLAGDSAVHYEIADKYRAMMKEALGNYDFLQGDSTTQVTTATGLALLGDYAARRIQAKNLGKKAGFERLYRLLDYMALECFGDDKIAAILDDGLPVYSFDSYIGPLGYVPALDVIVNIGDGVENSRSFTLSALSELCGMEITAENYPVVRAYIGALGIPERASLCAELDRRFGKGKEG